MWRSRPTNVYNSRRTRPGRVRDPVDSPQPMRRWTLWMRYGGLWSMRVMAGTPEVAGGHTALDRQTAAGELDRVAIAEVDVYGRTGSLTVVRIGTSTPDASQTATVIP